MIGGYSADAQVGRYTPSEISVLLRPRNIVLTRRPVLFAHGAGNDGTQILDGVNQNGITRNMACLARDEGNRQGFVVLSGNFGGAITMGNDAELAAMEAAWAWLQASGLCATDKVILAGASMGFMSINRFAAAHPSQVSGMIGWIPAIDIEDMRTRNVLGLRAGTNTAWGLPVGSFIGGVDQTPVPTRGKPLDSGNLAAVAAIPTHLFYSSADTVATSTAVDAYAAGRANVTKHLVSTTLDHSDAAILAADINTTVTFALSVSS